MIIVGISGDIGSGKSTFAELLARQTPQSKHWESWEVIAPIAEALRAQALPHPKPDDILAITDWLRILPASVQRITGKKSRPGLFELSESAISAVPEDYAKLFEYLHAVRSEPELAVVPVSIVTKEQFRSLLQWLGGYCAKQIDQYIWYDVIAEQIMAANKLDLAIVGGVRYPADADRLRQISGRILRIERPAIDERDKLDLTERQRHLISPDAIVANDGTLQQLADCAAAVHDDLAHDALKARYIASKSQA